ncbi:MAG: Hsp20/alpha crystallin family protein [Spirochaetota bacterium]
MIATCDIINDIDACLVGENIFPDYVEDCCCADFIESPFVNIYEKNGKIDVEVQAPGEKVEDINLQLKDNSLLIEYDKKSVDTGSCLMRERDYGKFSRSVNIPYKVDPDKISASMKDGILTVKLEMAEEAMPKKIQIQ